MHVLVRNYFSLLDVDNANDAAVFVGTPGTDQIPPESRVSPGNPSLSAKLMSIFCRSITAANSFPLTLQCIFGCIYGKNPLFGLELGYAHKPLSHLVKHWSHLYKGTIKISKASFTVCVVSSRSCAGILASYPEISTSLE